MTLPRSAALLGVGEFLLLCSYLDREYGNGIKFDVLGVLRVQNKVTEVTVMLEDGRKIIITSEAVARKK